MPGFPTPEEAALEEFPPEFVRVLGVAERGDEAVVVLLVNAEAFPDGAYETETVSCLREGGGWEESSSGNSDGGYIRTGQNRCTVAQLYEAPPDAISGRFRLGEIEHTVAVEGGFAFVVFDEVPFDESGFPTPKDGGHDDEAAWAEMGTGVAPWSWPHGLPSIEEWVTDSG